MTRKEALAWAREQFGPRAFVRDNGPSVPVYRKCQIRVWGEAPAWLIRESGRVKRTSQVVGAGMSWSAAVAEAKVEARYWRSSHAV